MNRPYSTSDYCWQLRTTRVTAVEFAGAGAGSMNLTVVVDVEILSEPVGGKSTEGHEAIFSARGGGFVGEGDASRRGVRHDVRLEDRVAFGRGRSAGNCWDVSLEREANGVRLSEGVTCR